MYAACGICVHAGVGVGGDTGEGPGTGVGAGVDAGGGTGVGAGVDGGRRCV